MAALLFQAYMKLRPIPLPPPDTFADQTAVVTGGTSGLGFAAAVHLLRLGAAEVIISARDAARGRDAAAQIASEAAAGGDDKQSLGQVRVIELDMSRYSSVAAFAEQVTQVKRGKGGVDVVVLNAGMIGTVYEKGPEGWERNLQTNSLSTALLAALLLPYLKSERVSRSSPAHLTLVGSMQHTSPDINRWHKWASQEDQGSGGVLKHLNQPENFISAEDRYAATKLILQYAFEELVKLARKDGGNSPPQVIMNAVCPGIVKTGLARDYQVRGGLGIRLAVRAFQGLFGKSAADGARSYLAAVMTKENQHAQVWDELCQELGAKVPGFKEILQSAAN
ncbi:short chain dehydrogenase/reductase family oxidoreductase [Apiospora aurea]|uniref:Short chain dehydrogenase/reductase family oxidoreductase n=1 Tax=Apiospora aurea TaxID=335848 RepID=A0ABR1Q8Z5_9PEZI